jgi:hypothetical protein
MNTLAYIIYLVITYFITVKVGLAFYRNGAIYILNLLPENGKLAHAINKMLLTGYYLLNLGYAAMMIKTWEKINNWTELISSIGLMTGKIMLTLALIHFMNMAIILLISQRQHQFINHKK